MTLLVQIGLNAEWEPCRLLHMSYGRNTYLRISINDDADYITLYGERGHMAEKLRDLLALVEFPESNPAISKREVTPLETIEKFRDSPDLISMASDVEATLSGLIDDADRVRQVIDPADLFDSQGQPVRGAQARIAQALGIPNAGAFRDRILSTLQRLQKSTTTDRTRSAGRKTA